MASLPNWTYNNLQLMLKSKFYGIPNVWLEFSVIVNSNMYVISIFMPQNINMQAIFVIKRNDLYEDSNLLQNITICGIIFTSTSRPRLIKRAEILAPGKTFLKAMLISHLKKYLQENLIKISLKNLSKWMNLKISYLRTSMNQY